ncbi:MAG: 50S ribosomal protein L25/general stress protein Ctc [Cyanobacteriota bacterium]|nr:50S ribosomal protein L25/general stress protein Ctc [Cyanobacteriota bacterium]
MELKVECKKRPVGSKPKALRRSGFIPAVLYGHDGAESVAITIEAKTVQQLLKDGSINNTLIQLNIPDLPWNGKTLLREVQTHPWKGYPYHLSFFSISTQDSVEVEVPLDFVGESVGVEMEGGVLDLIISELQVKCKPDSIPESIKIDISSLHLGDSLHVNELILPEGVVAIGEEERVVVSIASPRVETKSKETETEIETETEVVTE